MTRERDENTDWSRRVDFPYWDGLTRGELHVQRCASCGRWQWPADWRCPGCGSYDFDWPQVPARGVVYSWIRTHYAFVPGYESLLPYVSVLVELPHAGGARMLGLLRGDDGDNGNDVLTPAIGDPLVGIFEPAGPDTLDFAVLRWRRDATDAA